MRARGLAAAACLAVVGGGAPAAAQPATSNPTPTVAARAPYRTLDDRFTVRRYSSLAEWRERAAWLREHVLASAGLLPLPEKPPLNAVVFGERKHADYTVSKVYFESLPGFLVTGNLYRPAAGEGPFPAILSPHGHWTYGRLENSDVASVPGRAISFARQGFVVFTYDMVGFNDSRQVAHTPGHTGDAEDFGGRRERLWGLSLAGLQLWNAIRSLDFLESLPEVDRGRIGATGASGGGTQVFLLSAVDERVAVAAPVNMISLHMQGGCLCENAPGLRLDTNNVELSALIAPRPLLMVSASGDWTNETLELEYPEMRTFYALFGTEDRVHAVRMEAPHNYNRESREAVYAWMARWLKGAPPDVKVVEEPFRPDPLPDLMVFHGRPLPEGAVTAGELAQRWIAAARRQLGATDQRPFRAALLHALGFQQQAPLRSRRRGRPVVLLAGEDDVTARAIAGAGFTVHRVALTPFDAEAAAKVSHFDTYNRGPASQRVADLVSAAADVPRAVLVADGDAALAGLLAAAVAPFETAILDVSGFQTDSDTAFLERLDIPGLRRAGDLRTAAAMARGTVVVHNAGPSFQVAGATVRSGKLSAAEIVELLKRSRPIARSPAR